MQGIYRSDSLGLVSISSDGENWLTFYDRYLGATSRGGNGNVYARGDNYNFSNGGAIDNMAVVNLSGYGPGNYYNSPTVADYRTSGYGPGSRSSNSFNSRGGVDDTNEAKQGPCPDGFHVPSITELDDLKAIVTGLGLTEISDIVGISNFWTCNGSGSKVYTGYFGPSLGGFWYASDYNMLMIEDGYIPLMSGGGYILPFKNTPVMPDKTWTVLYGDVISTPVIIHGAVGTKKAIQTITPPWAPKTYNELVAMDADSAVAELNTNAEGYYNHFKDTNLYRSMSNAWISSDGTIGGVTKRGSYRIMCYYSTPGLEFLDDWIKTTSAPAP